MYCYGFVQLLDDVHEAYIKVEICWTWTTKNSARSCSDERSDYTYMRNHGGGRRPIEGY